MLKRGKIRTRKVKRLRKAKFTRKHYRLNMLFPGVSFLKPQSSF